MKQVADECLSVDHDARAPRCRPGSKHARSDRRPDRVIDRRFAAPNVGGIANGIRRSRRNSRHNSHCCFGMLPESTSGIRCLRRLANRFPQICSRCRSRKSARTDWPTATPRNRHLARRWRARRSSRRSSRAPSNRTRQQPGPSSHPHYLADARKSSARSELQLAWRAAPQWQCENRLGR